MQYKCREHANVAREKRENAIFSDFEPTFFPQLLNYFLLFQRESAALFAISRLISTESAFALAMPPFNPPSLPKATAAGFFSGLGVSGGGCWPVAR